MIWKKFLLSSAVLHLFLFDDNHVLARRDDPFHEGQTGGKKHFSKIIGGEQPEPGSYPWFARPLSRTADDYLWRGCGGMLVAPEFVLTAGHCGGEVVRGHYEIGAFCPEEKDNCGQDPSEIMGIKNVIPHPDYYGEAFNDLQLVHLDGTSTKTPVVMDIDNIAQDYEEGFGYLWAIGFGSTSEYGPTSDKLLHVQLNYVTDEDCDAMYEYESISENEMCASGVNKDSCGGDSGGPLYDSENEKLVGVVSWGYGCAQEEYPGVYAQVGSQMDWILSVICPMHGEPVPDYCSHYAPLQNCEGENQFRFDINFDKYPDEVKWYIADVCSGDVVARSSYYLFLQPYESIFERVCLDDSRYIFTIKDSFGDGLNQCGDDDKNCKYTISYYGEEVGSGEGNYGSQETHYFGLNDCGPAGPALSLLPSAPPSTSLLPSQAPSTSVPPSLAPTKFVCNDETTFKLEIQFDDYPYETSWNVVDVCDDNKEVASGEGSYYDNRELRVYNKCLTTTTKYRFTIYDSHGDGLYCYYGYYCGAYTVTYGDNEKVYGNGDFGDSSSHEFGESECVCNNGTKFKLEIQFDNFPDETSWNVVDVCDDNKEVASGEGSDNDSGELRVYNKCLTATTKYRFTIYDSYGDGLNCYYDCGAYTVTYGDNEEVYGNGDFGDSSSLEFGETECPKPKCSSIGYHRYLRKTFCKGRANSSNSKFARHWKVKDGEREDVVNTVCKSKPCEKSDCCEEGGQRKCTNTGNKGFVEGGFTKEMCGEFQELKAKKELKDSPCTGQDGFKCTKKDCCNAI